MLGRLANRCFLGVMTFLFSIQIVAAEPRPNLVRIGTFGVDERSFKNLRPGDPVNLDIEGKSYTGIYVGIQVNQGQREHVVINATEVEAGIDVGDKTSSGKLPQTSAGARHSGTSAAGAAAGTAALGQIVYRVVFVSPELEQRIAKGQAELAQAQSATKAAIVKYNLAVEGSVEKASTALSNLSKMLDESALNPPPELPLRIKSSPIQFTSTDEDLQRKLTVSYHQIVNARVDSPVHAQARILGIAALSQAEASSASGDLQSAKASLVASQAYAQFLRTADMLVGLDPVSGLVRDTFELVTGQNLITGEQLTDTERAVRAVSAGANLATLGAAAVVVSGIKTIAQFLKRMGGPGSAAFNRIFVIVENLPFTKHGMDAFTARRLELIINSKTETALTPAWIKRTINEGKSYWDRKHSTIAFISQHENGKWLHVAVTKDGQPVITTVIARDKFVADKVLYEGKQRFIPYLGEIAPIEIH